MTKYSKTVVELVEFTKDPDSVKAVVPNAVLINGQRVMVCGGIDVAYSSVGQPGEQDAALVTLTLVVGELHIDARQEGGVAATDRSQDTAADLSAGAVVIDPDLLLAGTILTLPIGVTWYVGVKPDGSHEWRRLDA